MGTQVSIYLNYSNELHLRILKSCAGYKDLNFKFNRYSEWWTNKHVITIKLYFIFQYTELLNDPLIPIENSCNCLKSAKHQETGKQE